MTRIYIYGSRSCRPSKGGSPFDFRGSGSETSRRFPCRITGRSLGRFSGEAESLGNEARPTCALALV